MNKKIFIFLIMVVPAVFFVCLAPAKADSNYDLKAESLTINSSKCEINQSCSFTAKVKNLGDSFTFNFPLNPSITASNYKADSSSSVSPQNTLINTNDYLTFTFSGVFSKIGQVTLTFKADPSGYLQDSNLNNNSVSLKVDVAGYDLAVESLTITPAKPIIKQNCYIKIKIKNGSSYNLYSGAGTEIVKSFPDFSITRASSTIPSLTNVVSSGGYLYYEYEGQFSSTGDKKFSFTIDPNNDLSEVDTANNAISQTISVLAPAATDLAVNSLKFSASQLIAGQTVDVTIGVKNVGQTSLTDGSGLTKTEIVYDFGSFEFAVGQVTLDDLPTLSAPLKPNDIFHYVFHGAFTKSGAANIKFSVNQLNALTEADKNNNATSTLVMVYKTLAEANDFTIGNQKLAFASSTAAVISWTTSSQTTGKVYYGLRNGNVYANEVSATAKSGNNFSATISGLTAGLDYIYQVRSKNDFTEKQSDTQSFTMPANNNLSITVGPALVNSGKTATTTWSTNLLSSGHVYYRKQGTTSFKSAGADTAADIHSVVLTGLEAAIYEFFVISTSTVGTVIKTSPVNFNNQAQQVSTGNTESAANQSGSSQTTADTSSSGQAITVLGVEDANLFNKLKGKIILKVQSKGEAYYLSPKDQKIYYLGKPQDAFQIIRAQAIGVTNENLAKVPVGLSALSEKDTDGDGYEDKNEIASGYCALEKNKKLTFDSAFTNSFKGKILLQVQGRGEAWYINPADGKRYFLARAADAFNIMRTLGVGIANSDFNTLSK